MRLQLTIFQENDIPKVIETLKKKLDQQWHVLVEPPVVVVPAQFTENGIVMEDRAWTPQVSWNELYINMPKLIDEALKEINVKYAYKKVIIEK
ncbi:hypothetical protein SJAV_17360 [Sulfurisphaera javensis]|uniref:Uncharacterized protein n=1 Tax=Sulfurisphaera javensis TaxID=2049879 RepID=A0AAT9GT45_9CREN